MSEAKLYYVSETGLVEGEALGRLRMYLSADYDALKAERDQMRNELAESRKNFAELQAELLASCTAWSDEITRSSKLEAELAAIRASEPRDYLRGRQRLEQEWCELQNLKAAYTPQPHPDVQALVEALEQIGFSGIESWAGDIAVEALAAYRKAP